MAGALVRAYALILQPTRIKIWGRRLQKAEALAENLASDGIDADVVADRRAAVRSADIITSATLSEMPLVFGEDVRPGTHVDLVRGFTPNMRESDGQLIASARVVVDVVTTLTEAGDVAQPLQAGLINRGHIAFLRDILTGDQPGRSTRKEITVFKSAGHALEDLAAAELLFKRWDSRLPVAW